VGEGRGREIIEHTIGAGSSRADGKKGEMEKLRHSTTTTERS